MLHDIPSLRPYPYCPCLYPDQDPYQYALFVDV